MDVELRVGRAESLPYPDHSFEVALSTTVLHCLSDGDRHKCIAEMIRVVKPGGHVLIVDFGGSDKERHSWMSKIHRHGRFDLSAILPQIRSRGLVNVEYETIGLSDLRFVRAGIAAPGHSHGAGVSTPETPGAGQAGTARRRPVQPGDRDRASAGRASPHPCPGPGATR